MKTWFKYIHLLIVCVGFTTLTYAQPANDACVSAIPINVGIGSCNSILYTNVAATTASDPTTPVCWSPNSLSHTVWFSFVATSADIEISTNFGGTLTNTQLAVYSGACGSLTQIGCQEDINTGGGLFHSDIILHGLTIGNTYYMLVDGNGNTTGTFGICAQQALPVGPALPVQDCATAQTLCSVSNVTVPNGVGGVGVTPENPSCFGAPGERSSNWYTFTVATSGTLAFTITPTAVIDYDFAIFNTSTSCPGTEIECNWSPNTGGTGTTGLGCAGAQCENTFTVTAGQTYTILVDRFTATSSAGFTLNFAGTTATFASPNPTFTATTVCIGTATQFTNTTNGNYTYNWNFGDGYTSNSENPTHTYATAGTYSVTLLLTAVPGGCQNAITQLVTVNPIPTVDAGIGGTVCSGGCITLGGSTNATGSTGTISFTNGGSYAIPDGSATGVYSPLVTSGLLPTTIAASSIASVCINMTHTWDSDLDIYLQCPDGTRIELSTDNGGTGDNYTNTCFTPTASSSITTGSSPFTGTYLPEQSFNVLNGCTANGTWQLFVQDDLSGDAGSILGWTITFNNNLPAFTWSPTTAMTNTTTLTPTVCPTSPTTYTLTANSGIGCTATDTVTVNVTTSNTIAAGTSQTVCINSAITTITLPTTGATGATFSGLPIGVTGSWASNTVTISGTPTASGTFNYTVTTTGGCPPATTSGTITVTPLNTITAGTSQTVCINSAITTITFPTTGATGATFSGLPAGVTGSWAANVATISGTPTTSGTFNYTVTTTGGCPPAATTGTITVTPLNTITTGTSQSVCINSAITTITLPTTGATGATFSGLPTGVTGSWVANVATISGTPTTSGTFNYTVTTTGGCPPATTLGTINVTPLNTITAGTSQTVCINSAITTITLPTTGATGATFSGLPAGVTGSWAVNVATISGTPTTSGTFNYTVTTTGGCPTATTSGTITVTPLNTITAGTSQTVCINAPITSITLPTTGATGATFSGLPAGVTGSWASNTVTIFGTPTTSGTFNYTVTTTGGCPPATTSGTITVTPLPVISLTPTDPTVCNGTNGVISVSGSGTGTIFWSGTASGSQVVAAFPSVISGLSSGNYNVYFVNSTNCQSATVSVTLNNPGAPVINSIGNITNCGTNYTLPVITGTNLIAPQYYTLPGGPSGGGTIVAVGTVYSAPTNITLYAYDQNGVCNSQQSFTIVINPLPTVTSVTGGAIYCSGSSVSPINVAVTGTPNFSVAYTLNGTAQAPILSATSPVSLGNAPGIYVVTNITDANCTNTASGTQTITITPLNTIAAGTSQTVCINSAITTITLPTTGATGATFSGLPAGVTGSWAANTVTIFGTPTASGTFNYTVTTTGGCPPATTSGTITVTPLPVISLTPTDPTVCNGTNGSISVSGSGTGTIFWSGTASGSQVVAAFPSVISGLSSGNYNVYFVNSTNCQSATVSVTLNNPGAPVINSIGNITNCGTNYTLPVITGTNLIAPQYYTLPGGPSGGGTIVAVGTVYSAPTNITLYAYDQNGVCNSQQSFTIVINPLPTITSVTGGAIYCSGSSVSPINVAVTGTPNFSVAYTLNGTAQAPILSATSPVSLGNAPGIYVVTNITDANCTNTASGTQTITITPLNTITAGTSQTVCINSAITNITLPTTGATGATFSGLPAGVTGSWAANTATIFGTPTTSGTFNYTVTTTGGCPPAATTGTITVTPLNTIAPGTSQTVCINSAITTITLPTTGATGATFSGLPAGVTGSWASNTVTIFGTPTTSGTFNYTVTTTGGCPPATTSGTITVTSTSTAAISYAGTPFCSSVTTAQAVTLTGTGIYTSGVYSSTAGLSINTATGAITPSTSTTGNYTITYTIAAGGGCPAVTTTTTITINSVVIPTFTAVAPICSGETLSPLPTISNNGITGTWLPSLNNTVTTPYIFTPTAGQCATTSTLIITVYSVPQINSISPLYYCDPNNDGFGVFDLTQVIPTITGGISYPVSFHETITDAEINGTTIPDPSNYFNIHINNQTIYIRVESTESSSCYKILTLELIVNPTPVAIEPDDYHVCDTNNDGFASFDLTTVAPQVFGSINQSTHSIDYYTSLSNAQLGTNPISNLTSFINQTINTQTIWIRITNSVTGCYDIVTLQLFVDPLPLATQPNYPPYTLCDIHAPLAYEEFDLGSKITDILIGQTGMNVTFHFSQADASADINPLPLLYTNTSPYVQTLWIRVENAITGCFVLSTIDIRVEPLPSPIPPDEPYTICDGNQDGFGTFDLNTLTADIVQGANYTITYHETFDDAQLGNNPLVSPYDNITPFVQIIYASVVDNVNGCRSVIPIELNVNPQPITPFTVPDLIQCDEDSSPQNLSMVFDLTQNDATVLAIQPLPASNYTVTYYISQTDANAGIAPIIQSTHYIGDDQEIIWVRVENNNSNCYSIGSFQLLINPPLALTTPTPLSICDDDANPNNQYTEFDLTVKNNEITGGLPNTTVTYYPSYPVNASSVAIPNPTTYTNISPAVQTLGVMVTNAQGCRSYTSLDIRVLPIPTPRTTGVNPLPAQCDINNTGDMLETFNLTLNASIIINGDSTLTLHYYPTQTDALADTNEILNPTAALVGHNVWIRVENNRVDYLGNHCFVLVEQALTVNPLPTIIQPLTIQNCDDNTDGRAPFNLTSTTASLLGSTQLPADFTITYYTSAANAQAGTSAITNPTNFTNTINPQIIHIRIVNNVTGCFSTGQFTLIVNPKPTATAPAPFETCDVDGTNDGFFTLDLSTYINGIIGAQTDVTTTFYNTQTDAANGTNAITNLTNYQAYTHTVWVRVENTITGCYQLTPLNITVEPLPEPIISSPTNNICVDYATNVLLSGLTLNSGISSAGYTFAWSLDGTVIPGAISSTYTINTVAPGDYTVVATSTTSLGCVSDVSNAFTVIQSGPAQFAEPPYTISNDFSDNQIITVNVVGFGVYEYSLDEGPFQTSNVFEHASLGEHTITVRDVKGNTSCGEIVIGGIQAIDYPHYFTPNGDGIHDTWNVIGLEDQPYARLYIFDRYGKLLKQLSTTGQGWDGNYNNHMLPADDYWFKVEYLDLTRTRWREFKSHFTLKR